MRPRVPSRLMSRLFASVALAVVPGLAHGVDGTILIDQNKAAAGGVTPGDTPGFPVTISRPGSYRLASNLVVADANTSAIEVTPNTPGVTIDLNGFTILGPSVCSGFPLSCSHAGTGYGVTSGSAATTVRNGTVLGMGNYGLALTGAASAVEDVTVRSNAGGGILLNLGTVNKTRVGGNGGVGINANNSVITYNTVFGNRSAGIDANDSVVTHNAIVVNGGVGLAAANTGFGGNTFSSNNGGFFNPQFSGRVAIAPNSCDGNVCP